MPRAAGARRCSPPRTGPRSSRWPARCRPSPACRCRKWSSPDLAREVAARCQRRGLGIHDPPVAGRRRPQALAAPVLDLRPRPRLRRQGRPGARPVRRDLGRPAAGPGRLRDLRRREDHHPGPVPLPPHPAPGQSPRDAGRARLRPRAARWPTWPPGTSAAAGHRPVRGHHRDRAVRPAGGAGDDHRAVRQRGPGLLDHRQRLLPPRRRLHRADGSAPGRTRT